MRWAPSTASAMRISRPPTKLDWTRRFGGPALVVVRPANTSEVASVLAACSRFQVAVVPQGGNTGLVGGSVPRGGEAVLSLGRLNRVLSCDPDEGLLVAEAGTTLATAQAAAASVHAALGIDIAARDSATLGAWSHQRRRHPRHPARPDARAARWNRGRARGRHRREPPVRLVKDNVGYDLAQIMTGSEGTLAW